MGVAFSEESYLLAEAGVAVAFLAWRVIVWKSKAFFATTMVEWLFVASVVIVLIGSGDSLQGRFWITVIVCCILFLSMFSRVHARGTTIVVRRWYGAHTFSREEIDHLEVTPSWPEDYGESNLRLWITLRNGTKIDGTAYEPIRGLISAIDQPVRSVNDQYEKLLRASDGKRSIRRVAVVISLVALAAQVTMHFAVPFFQDK